MLNILWAELSTQFLNHHLKAAISNIWISRTFYRYLLKKEMFSSLKTVQGVKSQQLISDAAMKLQNQEHSPRAAIFIRMLFCFLNSSPFCLLRVLGAVMILNLGLIVVHPVSFFPWFLLLWHIFSFSWELEHREIHCSQRPSIPGCWTPTQSSNQIILKIYVKWQMY